MKFGKHLQKRQLDIPEYAASFVNYKALKKLIKKLSATPTLHAQNESVDVEGATDPQMALQANKATFFFRLERELDKVNEFYLQKEAELQLRLKALLDKKKLLQSHDHASSKLSATFMALEEGFQQFGVDLNKLQQFVEVNATAFSKILKKWDKVSKSRTKELYLSRAVEVQPCFNRDVISELSDMATTSLLKLGAWAEGEKVQLDETGADYVLVGPPPHSRDEDETASQLLDAANLGNIGLLQDWLARLQGLPNARPQIDRVFLAAIAEAPEEALAVLVQSALVNVQAQDEINERNCLHEASIYGRLPILHAGLASGVDVSRVDVYGRIPLHYACIHGRIDMLEALIEAAPNTVNFMDHDRFTSLIHAIVHGHLECVQKLLSYSARINPSSESDHIPLNMACQHGFTEIVRLLLANRAQILCDAEGLFPQHLVARSGRDPHLLLMLRDFGADLNEVDRLMQWTPLFHAASEGHVACIRTLLENGARTDLLDEKELSAVYYAAWEGHLESMRLLSANSPATGLVGQSAAPPVASTAVSINHVGEMPVTDVDGIPDLSLPPPFIPLRRYGHNFLDSKTFIQIHFDGEDSDGLIFYNGGRYPAARLTISSKSSDLIPRNILLPFQEDTRTISFQVDNLDSFAIDFDIFPTFGAKVIARTAALPNTFNDARDGAGRCSLPLFDPRLRAIGQISFNFQAIKPFQGTALEITDFATYWKATTQFDSHPTAPITESSLTGEHVRLCVQLTSDLVPVLCSRWYVKYGDIDLPVSQLTYAQFVAVGAVNKKLLDLPAPSSSSSSSTPDAAGSSSSSSSLTAAVQALAGSAMSLKEALRVLPSSVHVDLHVMYPSGGDRERERSRLRATASLNRFADAILSDVFDHSRHLRQTCPDFMRSIIFSSYSSDFCTALNWKQPNYPVFLCNDLGKEDAGPVAAGASSTTESETGDAAGANAAGQAISIKEAVKIAQNNNFMGLICCSRLLDMVPALVESIRAAGLVLVADTTGSSSLSTSSFSSLSAAASSSTSSTSAAAAAAPVSAPTSVAATAAAAAPAPAAATSTSTKNKASALDKVDGMLTRNGVLRFGPVMG